MVLRQAAWYQKTPHYLVNEGPKWSISSILAASAQRSVSLSSQRNRKKLAKCSKNKNFQNSTRGGPGAKRTQCFTEDAIQLQILPSPLTLWLKSHSISLQGVTLPLTTGQKEWWASLFTEWQKGYKYSNLQFFIIITMRRAINKPCGKKGR